MITSTFHPAATRLSYSPTRGALTPAQRLAQTLDTTRSIRLRVPDAAIFLCENSPLPDDIWQQLEPGVDYLMTFDQDPVACAHRDSPHKGAGELYMVTQCMTVLRHVHYYRRLFKISGRYRLNDHFSLDHFSTTAFGVKYRELNISTRLYCVPKLLKQRYEALLAASLKAACRGRSIEDTLLRGVPSDQISPVATLGVEGVIGAGGDEVVE